MSKGSCYNCGFVDTPFLAGVCGPGFGFFMGLLEFILKKQCDIADPCRRPGLHGYPLYDEQYDFIVVGAGVAGPVVAGRLSENPNWKVLLLEAGPNEPTATSVPAFAMSAVGTDLDWKYTTEPSANACLSTGGRCSWPRGKMISGSSGMQGMMYTRPHHSVLDGWGKTNPGWSFKEVLPYFIKSERNLNPELVEEKYHGFSGPMTIQQFPWRPHLADAVVEAGKQLGYKNGDLCGSNQTGVAVAQMMLNRGLRVSTARAYLRPFTKERENLRVLVNAQVTKVLINPATNQAYGVVYIDKSQKLHKAYASKEVILSAGAINSPQLLLLSGVGPKKDLSAVGINTIVNRPGVGRNLQNHVASDIGFYMDDDSTNSLTINAFFEFVNNRTGPLACTGLTQTTIFMTSKHATDGVPDLQVFFDGFLGMCSKTGADNECEGTGTRGNCSKRLLYARPTNVRPLSIGYLKLKSKDPLEHPLIYPNYFSNPKDVEVLVEGLKLAIALAQTPALQKYNLTIDNTQVKGCERYKFGTDEYFSCVIRMETGPEHHQAGSCKMGPARDPMAVVDHRLRVHGVKNLRVVDASIFPKNPNSNPTSVIIMAGEKAADMIKKSWKKR